MTINRPGSFGRRWIRWALVLASGGMLRSCATDVRDAAVSGGLDYVTGTVTALLDAAIPLPEFE